MLRTAKDCIKIREEKLNIFNKSQEEIKGQMKLIESKVMNANIGHRTKYIDLGNVGKLFSENEKQIIKDGYYITQDDKNGTRLYFDEKDYNDYVNSNKKVNEATKDCNKRYSKALNDLNDNVNSDKKSDLKKDTDEQVKEDKKVETNKNNTDENFKLIFSTFDGKDYHEKEYNSFEELKKDVEIIPEFFKIFE